MNGVHRAEWDDSSVRDSVVHVTMLNSFKIEVVWVLKMHDAEHDDMVHELRKRIVVSSVQEGTQEILNDSLLLDVSNSSQELCFRALASCGLAICVEVGDLGQSSRNLSTSIRFVMGS